MQSTAKGKASLLSKHSSKFRGDWKRRFFVLDGCGMLYYYRKQDWGKKMDNAFQHSLKRGHHATDHVYVLFGWFLSSHHHGPSQDERSISHHTINLLTSTIKLDAEQTDLQFCFTIVSLKKKYTFQVENAMDCMN
ncbi:hypothetical protein SUGI_1128920 [Cryptomeria japonica]|nr:hypothetical protein SUGI_1128920 [Cryptomeria japonica]